MLYRNLVNYITGNGLNTPEDPARSPKDISGHSEDERSQHGTELHKPVQFAKKSEAILENIFSSTNMILRNGKKSSD